MKVLCVSASNVVGTKDKSASTKTCNIIKNYLETTFADKISVEVLALVDYAVMPCIMCSRCSETKECMYDPAFNTIYSKLISADGIVIVTPHYAPIPSKLIMLMEKLEEFAFIHYCSGKEEAFELSGKIAAIIGHGGQIRDYEETYKTALLNPISQALASVGIKSVPLNDEYPNGAVFGLSDYQDAEDSLMPLMTHDWEKVSTTVIPLVNNLVKALEQS